MTTSPRAPRRPVCSLRDTWRGHSRWRRNSRRMAPPPSMPLLARSTPSRRSDAIRCSCRDDQPGDVEVPTRPTHSSHPSPRPWPPLGRHPPPRPFRPPSLPFEQPCQPPPNTVPLDAATLPLVERHTVTAGTRPLYRRAAVVVPTDFASSEIDPRPKRWSGPYSWLLPPKRVASLGHHN